jgi:hypothetical protein
MSLNSSPPSTHQDEIPQPSKMSMPKTTENPAMTGNKTTKMTKTQKLESRQQTRSAPGNPHCLFVSTYH